MEENGGAVHANGTIVVCKHDNGALIDSCVRLINYGAEGSAWCFN